MDHIRVASLLLSGVQDETKRQPCSGSHYIRRMEERVGLRSLKLHFGDGFLKINK